MSQHDIENDETVADPAPAQPDDLVETTEVDPEPADPEPADPIEPVDEADLGDEGAPAGEVEPGLPF